MPLEAKPVLRESVEPCRFEQGRTYFLGVGTEIRDASAAAQPEQAIIEPHFAALRSLRSRPVDEAADFITLSDT